MQYMSRNFEDFEYKSLFMYSWMRFNFVRFNVYKSKNYTQNYAIFL